MIDDYDKGGLKMIDIQSFNESLKMKWIQGYFNNDNQGKWKLFVDYYLQKYGGQAVFLSNLKPQDVLQLNKGSFFEGNYRTLDQFKLQREQP